MAKRSRERSESINTDHVHARLWRIVCSAPWEEHLFGEILRGRVGAGSSGMDLEVRLRRAELYPPGTKATSGRHGGAKAGRHEEKGPRLPRTLMRRCRACTKWVPGNCVGSVGVCFECFCERQPLPVVVQYPSANRFTWAVPAHQAAHAGLATVRRSLRARFKFDGRQVRGGHVDESGFLVDPTERSSTDQTLPDPGAIEAPPAAPTPENSAA